MGVHIDEAGGHEQPVGIDFTRSATGDATDLDDPAIRYCYIGREPGRSRTIENGAAPYNQIDSLPPNSFISKSMENRRGTASTAPMPLMANLTGQKRRTAAIDRIKIARR